MRVFFGIDLDPEIHKQLKAFVDQVSPYAPLARWTSPASWHVTLKFIGEASPAKVAEMTALLSQSSSPSFPVNVASSGFFPPSGRANVFWAGVQGGDAIRQLAVRLDSAMAGLGFEKEAREYSPHLTLARAPRGEGGAFRKLQSALTQRPQPDFGTMSARTFFLYESRTLAEGAQYTKIARFELI